MRLLLAVLLMLLGANVDARTVRIASKKFTESVILAEAATQLLNANGLPAEHQKELGGSRVVFEALLRGDVDAYPEYTGTLRTELLPGSVELKEALAARGLESTGTLGFQNSYALGMKAERAEALGVQTLSDLARHPELKLGLSNEFMDRQDGWPALVKRYGFSQASARGLDHDLAYRALDDGQIDVTDLYSTDAEIQQYGLRVLRDDRGAFPEYAAVLLFRADVPAAVKTQLQRLSGSIDAATMIDLNARAKVKREPETQIAASFLEQRFQVHGVAKVESATERLWRRTAEHLVLVGTSLFAAVVVAIPLGIIAARRRRLGALLTSAAGVVQTIPSLALLVFMLPLLGIGARPAIAALFLYSVLPILRGTHSGLTSLAPELRDSADALGLSELSRLRLIELPLASRAILSGIKTAAVINVGTATLGALIGAGGYGQPILTGIRLADNGLILEGAVPAAVMALVTQGLFDLSERWLVPRGLR